MNELSLFSLFLVFGVGTFYAGWREHWYAFGVLLAMTLFSAMGILFRLIS